MSAAKPPTPPAGRKRVGLAANEDVRRRYIGDDDLARLEAVAAFSYLETSLGDGRSGPVERDVRAESELAAFAGDLDVLVVCDGAPFASSEVIAAAKRLTLIGELDGDRFGYRVDLEAAKARSIRVIDMSHASSYPTAEWALGLALVGRRNAGAFFRKMIAHERPFTVTYEERSGPGYDAAELGGKRVGMIGFGHLARHLVDLLRPFKCDIVAFDPYAPRVLAEPYGIRFGSLETVLASEVVFVLAPETPTTEGMLGARELSLLRPGSVFVNVARGKIVDSEALIARLARGDVIACLDVFDPEPVPLDSSIVDLPNVFISPHLGGVTEESRRRFFTLMVDQCLKHFDGFELDGEITTESVRLSPQRNSS
jgi:D-3-phosphoglycerate dehydrogenase / 2-oxoglutarate reductase